MPVSLSFSEKKWSSSLRKKMYFNGGLQTEPTQSESKWDELSNLCFTPVHFLLLHTALIGQTSLSSLAWLTVIYWPSHLGRQMWCYSTEKERIVHLTHHTTRPALHCILVIARTWIFSPSMTAERWCKMSALEKPQLQPIVPLVIIKIKTVII